jgi:hypothetical protein
LVWSGILVVVTSGVLFGLLDFIEQAERTVPADISNDFARKSRLETFFELSILIKKNWSK